MSYRLDKMIETIDVETFIQRTHEIMDKIKCNPTYVVKAQEEAHILLAQFEEYLKSKGLERPLHCSLPEARAKRKGLRVCS